MRWDIPTVADSPTSSGRNGAGRSRRSHPRRPCSGAASGPRPDGPLVMPRHPVVLAITGASGAPYAVRLLEALVQHAVPTWLIVSSHGWRLLRTESGLQDLDALRVWVGPERFDAHVTVFDDGDRGAAPASGSARTSGMIVCPCSMGTVSAIAHGTSRSLVERAADAVSACRDLGVEAAASRFNRR